MSRAKYITEACGGDWRGTYGLIAGPGHSKKDRSVSIKDSAVLHDGVFVYSYAGDCPLLIKDRLREEGLLPPLQRQVGPTSRPPSSECAEYVYEQVDGTPYLKVTRKPDKRFHQSHWDGAQWRRGAPKGPKIPYRLPQMIAAVHDAVFLVEGEKDADNLTAKGFVATTCPGGSNGWTDDLVQHFEGRTVYVVPDNDEPGREFAERAAVSLYASVESVRICPLPDLPPKGDVTDWLEAGGDPGELVDICRSFPVWRPSDGTISAAELQKLDLPPVEYIVPGMIPKGLTLVAGKPKMGKSWAMLGLGIALATGGEFLGHMTCKKRNVLYAALEDNPQRLKDRLETLQGDKPWPENLRFEFAVSALDNGGIDEFKRFCKTYDVDVLIIDVFQKVKPSQRGGGNDYAHDYASVGMLHKLANELEIAIIIVHHLRKSGSDEPLDCVSGTTGVTGAVDMVITITSGPDGEAVWVGRGRDIEEFEWSARLVDGAWSMIGDACKLSADQRKILEALQGSKEPMSPSKVAVVAGLKEDYVRQTLRRLVKRGVVFKVRYGLYSATPSHCHSSEEDKRNHVVVG